MAREKELFRDNLQRLDEKFPDRELLTLQDVRIFCGISDNTARKIFPFVKRGNRYFISKIKLASELS